MGASCHHISYLFGMIRGESCDESWQLAGDFHRSLAAIGRAGKKTNRLLHQKAPKILRNLV